MATVSRSITVAAPVARVAAVVTDPAAVFELIGALGRTKLVATHADGSQDWDLYLDIGTMFLGGRVTVDPPTPDAISWRSTRGTRHDAHAEVVGADGGARVTMTTTVQFSGMVTGRLAAWLSRDILGRQIDAGLQRLRHRVEWTDSE